MPTEKEILKVSPGQRIDEPDFSASQESQLIVGAHDMAGLATGQGGYIVTGFSASGTTSTLTIQKNRADSTSTTDDTTGAAILPYRASTGVDYGYTVIAGTPSRAIDVSTFAPGTYQVYLTLNLRDSEQSNRTFWNPNPASGGPIEYIRNVPTRTATDWGVLITQASPGAEYVLLADMVWSGSTMTVTDRRDLFFEGSQANSFAASSDWGTTQDRNSNRALNGVSDLRTFVRAVQRQIADLNGTGTNWWDTIVAKLNRDGSNTVAGNILPDSTANVRDLGSAAAAYNQFFVERIQMVTNALPSASQSPRQLTGVDDADIAQLAVGPPNTALDVSGLTPLRVTGVTATNPIALVQNSTATSATTVQVGSANSGAQNRTRIRNTPGNYTAPSASLAGPTLELLVGDSFGPGRIVGGTTDRLEMNRYLYTATKFNTSTVAGVNYYLAVAGSPTINADGSVVVPTGTTLLYDLTQAAGGFSVGTTIVTAGIGTTGGVAADWRIAVINYPTGMTTGPTIVTVQSSFAAFSHLYAANERIVMSIRNDSGADRTVTSISVTWSGTEIFLPS